ncbi:aldo/keto reductase [uncultured Cohaesibacter sp.]|uniref:aldo/keto reductase n=1 Tax=uncultured Cohaesibacter sp. TaxID=1002546 RepID=UPI00292FB77D|nr:aldo/keto reductase [uncultured Cohaesibacter sp.]
MEKRKLGRTDLEVSSLCLGTMTWGEQNTKAEAYEQLDYAVDQGINFIDTAELYPVPSRAQTQGRTEEIIGDWMKDRGNRSDIILATKIIGRSENDWYRDGGVAPRLNRAQVLEAVDKNLKRLKTDYIDLYQIHWPDRKVTQFGSNPLIYSHPGATEDETPIAETIAAMQELVKAGKVRHVGLSNESAWGMMNYLNEAETGTGPRVVSIQNAYSLLNRTFEINLAEIAMREQVGLLAYSSLGQGVITGKYLDGKQPAGARMTLFKNFGGRYQTIGAEPAVRRYLEIAEKFEVDVAQMALAFVLSRPFTTSVILGATKMEQLKTDIASHEFKLTDEMKKELDAVHMLHSNPCP